MNIVCLDMEGVLVPEIWVEFSKASNIPELTRTTREEPDYDKLMAYRIEHLNKHGYGIREIQETIAGIEPLEGAKEFLDELRSFAQVIIVSDTFEEFAQPLLEKLGRPTIFCSNLKIDEEGRIVGHIMRCDETKLTTVRGLQEMGFDTIASGDSHNDIKMIQASKAGFFFRTTDELKETYPEIPALETFDELLAAIKEAW